MSKLKDFFRKYFITGMFVIIPIWATYYVLSALLGVIDGILADLPRQFIGVRIPGMGIITLLLFVLLVGMLSANYLGKGFVRFSEGLLQKVPYVRGVYTTFKQVMETFSMPHNFHGVAAVEYPRKGCWSVGFVTGEVQGDRIGATGRFVSVFVPTTPNPTAGLFSRFDRWLPIHAPMTFPSRYTVSTAENT